MKLERAGTAFGASLCYVSAVVLIGTGAWVLRDLLRPQKSGDRQR